MMQAEGFNNDIQKLGGRAKGLGQLQMWEGRIIYYIVVLHVSNLTMLEF